jgi:hypothetical protein
MHALTVALALARSSGLAVSAMVGTLLQINLARIEAQDYHS